MQLGDVAAEGSFTFEGLFTTTTVVTESSRKVSIFDVIPQIVQMRAFFSTEGALQAWLPIIRTRFLHVLVEHLSCTILS